MNRQQRREQERQKRKDEKALTAQAARQFESDMTKNGDFDSRRALSDPHYMKHVVDLRKKQREAWDRNGITKEDLDKEYDRGYNAAMRELSERYAIYFFAGATITMHRDFGFGQKRLHKMLQTMYNIMSSEITTYDILERCLEETGVDIKMQDMKDEFEVDISEREDCSSDD